jgi:endosialidase-like protein
MRRLVLALSLATLALPGAAHANVPTRFTVQGVLRDNTGVLQTTMVTFVVKIWQSQNSMAASDLLFTYSPAPPNNVVMAQNGLFTIAVTLAPADVSAIAASLANASVTSLWLEVTANGFVYSRQPLTEVMSAIFADGLSPNCSGCVVDSMMGGMNASKLSGVVAIANGGTGSSTQNFVDLSTAQSIGGAKTFSTVAVTGQLTTSSAVNVPAINSAGTGYFHGDTTPLNGYGPGVIIGSTASFAYLAGVDYSAGPAGRTLAINAAGGNVGIVNTTPAYTLDVGNGGNGTVRANVVAPSDARLKTNIRTLEHALDGLADLRGVRFNWKKNGKASIGVIAQELEKVYPELVSTAPDGMKSVDYEKLTAILIQATKEQHAADVKTDKRVERLEAENSELRTRLDRLERAISHVAETPRRGRRPHFAP